MPLLGLVLTLLLAAAAPLPARAAEQGILFQGEGFTVSSEGRALGNASIGDPVQVRAASGKLLSGVVQEAGVVVVR